MVLGPLHDRTQVSHRLGAASTPPAEVDRVTLGSPAEPDRAGWMRLAGLARGPGSMTLEVVAAAGEDSARVRQQADQHQHGPGTPGQRLARALTAAAEEGMGWKNYRSAALKLFTLLETAPEASSDERDLATVARTCLEACDDPENGGKVGWSFLSELQSGRTDAPSQRLARILLDASERGMSWANYARVLRVGLDVLESDGTEGILLQAARRSMDACGEASHQGKIGRSLMNMLTTPVQGKPEAAVGRMFLMASEEGLSWDDFARSTGAALELLGEEPLEPERLLFVQAARAAQSGGEDSRERGKIGRAFLQTMTDSAGLGASLHLAGKRAADEGLSWSGFECALQNACDLLKGSEHLSERDRAALSGPWSGEIQERCQQRADAMKAIGDLVGIREQLERLSARPGSEGIELTQESLTVGGVRLKVKR